MKVSFLLGSGASVPASFPTVGEITKQVFSELPEGESAVCDHRVISGDVGRLLRWLAIQIQKRYPSEGVRVAHYENLYFLAAQLHDDTFDEYDNPAIEPFGRAAVEHVFSKTEQSPNNAREKIADLAGEASTLIRQIVTRMLDHAPRRFDHLSFIIESIQDSSGVAPTILTLNHDSFLDGLLKDLKFTDGFSKTTNSFGVRQWRGGLLTASADYIRVLKLHGGVNWFRFRPKGAENWFEEYVGIPTLAHSPRIKDADNRANDFVDPLPIFMIGSWDKLARYTDELYLEIYFAAYRALHASDVLVVVGYGFGDKGINKLVAEWMCRSRNNRLVVIDRAAGEVWQWARGAVAGKWENWLNEQRLFPMNFDLSQPAPLLSWSQIKQCLGN
jgi:hypothetical protein